LEVVTKVLEKNIRPSLAIKILPLGFNTGIASALNFGIGQVTGDVLFLTGHDDIWEHNRVSEALSRHTTGCDLFHSKMSVFGARSGFMNSLDEITLLRMSMLSGNRLLAPSISVRFDDRMRQIFWFSSKFNYAEDYELWTRLILTDIDVKYSNKPLVRYRVHEKSASSLKMQHQREIAEEVRKVYCSRVFPELPVVLASQVGAVFGSAMYKSKIYSEDELRLLGVIEKRITLFPMSDITKQVREGVRERILEVLQNHSRTINNFRGDA
jgi:hypothetical protein